MADNFETLNIEDAGASSIDSQKSILKMPTRAVIKIK